MGKSAGKFIFFIFCFWPLTSFSTLKTVLPVSKKTSFFHPYVPVKEDYALELGSMWEKNSLYWMGANIGLHMGRCMFTQSQTCQQYFDIIGGAGGRHGLTLGVVMGGIRWQYVNFPSGHSPSIKFLGGVMNIHDEKRDKVQGIYGVGFALTSSVHRRIDLKTEFRVGGGERLWSQAFISLNLKMDKWIEYFGHKLKQFGEGTGTVIKKTIEAPKEIIKSFEQ